MMTSWQMPKGGTLKKALFQPEGNGWFSSPSDGDLSKLVSWSGICIRSLEGIFVTGPLFFRVDLVISYAQSAPQSGQNFHKSSPILVHRALMRCEGCGIMVHPSSSIRHLILFILSDIMWMNMGKLYQTIITHQPKSYPNMINGTGIFTYICGSSLW